MKLIYISKGNIPSRWAHTVNIMKMSEELNQLVRKFTLVTQCDLRSFFRKPFDYFGWYGIQKPFHITRLPLLPRQASPMITGTYFQRFDRLAVRYAALTGADLVYTRTALQAKYCIEQNLPVILEAHFGQGPEFDLLPKIAASPELKRIVTISPFLRETYAQIGVPVEKILVAPDAVDLSRYKDHSSPNPDRVQLGLPTDKTLVTYCGHLYEGKGVDLILQAAAILPDIHFQIIGGQEEDLNGWRASAHHLSNIQFQGFVPNSMVPNYLKVSDILLMPYSSSEVNIRWISPMKLYEYMAARKPIIASDFPSLRETLTNEENALLIPPDDPLALAQAIRRLDSDPILRGRLADAAWETVQPHTWKNRAAVVLSGMDIP